MSSSLCDTIWLSEKRKNLLLLLMEGPRDIEQIKTSLNVTSKAMMPQIKILKKQGLILQKDDTYILSEIGKLVVGNMLPLLNTLEVIEENKEYWASRDTSVIPNELFMRLGELGECRVIEPDLNHLFDLPREFTENLIKSRCIMSSLSYYHPLYPSLYSKLAKSGAEMELVLTRAVFERLKNDFAEMNLKPCLIPKILLSGYAMKACSLRLLLLLKNSCISVFLINKENMIIE